MRLVKNDNLWTDTFSDLDRFFNRALGYPSELSLLRQYSDESIQGVRLDTFHDDDNYYVVAELPGIDKKDVNLELENAVLTISAERRSGEGENTRSFKFSRSVTVGDDVDSEKVSAKLENGMLTVTLPKSEQRKPRAISIK